MTLRGCFNYCRPLSLTIALHKRLSFPFRISFVKYDQIHSRELELSWSFCKLNIRCFITLNYISLFLKRKVIVKITIMITNCIYPKNVISITNFAQKEFAILSKWFVQKFKVLNPHIYYSILLGVPNNLQTNLICKNVMIKTESKTEHLELPLLKTLIFLRS